MFLLFGLILVFVFSSDVFYVRSIQARGASYISREEIFAFADIADYHMFWLDPAQIRRNILRSPSIADVSLELGWPPDLITLAVQERQPAIVWEEAEGERWIDLQGRVMPARAEMPNLLRVSVVDEGYAGARPMAEDFGKDEVLGALRLKDILPAGERLRYHPAHGLGWTSEQGWQVWMGSDGAAIMSEKIQMYEALTEHFNSLAIPVAELNIANPDAPFYRVLWGQ